jgi:hypothetical protein
MTSKPKKPPLTGEQKRALEEAWLEENRAAIRAHNERIEKYGTMLKPSLPAITENLTFHDLS